MQIHQLTGEITRYEKAGFRISIGDTFSNPYRSSEVALNMLLESPSGKVLLLPAYFESQAEGTSVWNARFTPQESGAYAYHFELIRDGKDTAISDIGNFIAGGSGGDGFLHIDGFWTLKFDSGKPFRGIGENVGWEARTWEDPKWTYDYLLASLAGNDANFFRVWMCPWNFPVAWPEVSSTYRYSSSGEYYNPDGIRRLDEVVEMIDSLDLFMMLAFNHHGAIIGDGGWELNRYNKVNGGPAATPEEFFTSPVAREMFRDQLRYIVARWGYSPHIGAWEFFNEVDNAVYYGQDSIIIPHGVVTDWHREMAAFLKSIDPYDHIVTTSVSHREIEGLYALEELDLNQMHVYKRTKQIPEGILMYVDKYRKPFSWGEFGYEWDWNKDFTEFADEMDHDYRIGLWYGLFHPTPILPMTWWWEFFEERNMTPYFKSVAEISDRMLEAGEGSIELLEANAGKAEAYAVKCGETIFVYLLNDSGSTFTGTVEINVPADGSRDFSVLVFDPDTREYLEGENTTADQGKLILEEKGLAHTRSVIIILTPDHRDPSGPEQASGPYHRLKLTHGQARRIAGLPLSCVDIQYPNKPGHVLMGEDELLSPKINHPAFYGCFDWHSSVHAHWSMVWLVKNFPELAERELIIEKLQGHITAENILAELRYFRKPHEKAFERTYGWAWLLKLAEELRTWDDPVAREFETSLQPLTDHIVEAYLMFLPKLVYPVRVGTHDNTAFGLSLAWDYAEMTGHDSLKAMISEKAREFFLGDRNCPLSWEPGGFDFLSPCLQEADIMRKILPEEEFRTWLRSFLPELSRVDFSLEPGEVSDRTDGHLVHLDGVNFSRAWCLYGIAATLPEYSHLIPVANAHISHSLPNLVGDSYEGGHWLGTFAIYALREH